MCKVVFRVDSQHAECENQQSPWPGDAQKVQARSDFSQPPKLTNKRFDIFLPVWDAQKAGL